MHYAKVKLIEISKILRGKHPYPRRYDQLYKELVNMKARRFLEIGVNDGTNAVRLAKALQAVGVDAEYFGLDLFEYQKNESFLREFSLRVPSMETVESYLKRHGIKKPTLIAGDSTKVLPEVVPTFPKMDGIFIDGGHSYETVLSDWNNVQPLIDKHTVVFFDDYPNWGIKPVVDQIDRSKWDVQILPTSDQSKANPDFADAHQKVMNFQLARVQKL